MLRYLVPALLFAAPLQAQTQISTEPAQPARGSLIRIHVTPNSAEPLTGVTGEIAGNPLHLSTTDQATWSGFAPIPVDGEDTLTVVLSLNSALGSKNVPVLLTVQKPPYPSEKLTV